ncbi:hypothetical protein RR46_11996 [Papilio xuthus]|uniref:C-type lectin domain-containing protein n=1 Tax=Papilio xuthus TaxID=66420 RepID=A0A194PNV3_PAPXU|nr:hypothetical protein RR46_11996 [Papilio xuthus]
MRSDVFGARRINMRRARNIRDPTFLFTPLSSLSSLPQRITTIQLDGVQYFISRMNPYSPELNYFLAYQYCRYVILLKYECDIDATRITDGDVAISELLWALTSPLAAALRTAETRKLGDINIPVIGSGKTREQYRRLVAQIRLDKFFLTTCHTLRQVIRSLGLQLASFETKEKADSITTYLLNAGYNKYDFWTSGNNLGTDMYLWMSTGLPFNATFNYMRRMSNVTPYQHSDDSMDPVDLPQGSTAPQRTARHGTEHVMANGCVALKQPDFHWEPQHCGEIKDFICEQTRCYYYNYGSIPVSSAQGKPLSLTTTTTAHPLTSSSPPPPRSEHLPTHFNISVLFDKLQPSALDGLRSPHLKSGSPAKASPQIDSHYSRAADARSHEQEQEKEEPTQGPYDNEEGMVGDDAAAYLAQEAGAAGAAGEGAPSTAEPDATEHSVHASGMLAPPRY